jgi:putative transposase
MTTCSQGLLGIEPLCRLAGVSRAGYYRHWQASAPRQEQTELRDAIQKLALAHRHYGYRRIAAQLHRDGWVANHKRVLRLMHQDNLLCLRRRAFAPRTTDSQHGWQVVPNLARGLVLTGIDQLWVADITYVHLREAFAYLAIVLDAHSRRVIGWALETHLQASLACCPGDGPGGTPAAAWELDPPFGPGRAIRLCRLRRPSTRARHPGQHEPGRQSLR